MQSRLYAPLILLLLITPVNAQEFVDPLARKVTNFLPTYTPFTPPELPDRYFPDEVGKKVADAIIDGFLGDSGAVEKRVRELSRHDVALTTKGRTATGVTSHVRALLNRPQQADEDAVDAIELDTTPSALLTQADQLLASEKRGRLGRTFNWVLSTLDVGSLLLGTPRSPSPYSAQGVISGWRDGNEPAPRERKALVLYREFLRRAPEDPRAAAVQKKVEEIDTRRRNVMLQAELANAKAASQKRDYWGANFHYQLALMVDEDSAEARAGLEKVEASLQKTEDVQEVPPQDPLAGVRQAEWEHDKETLKYVLPGSSFVKDNFVVAGVQVTTEGLVGAGTFGAITLVQTVSRLYRALFSNAVSHEKVIAEAEKYVHETSPSERSPEVYDVLAEAYEKEGQLEKAIAYHSLAGREKEALRLQERAGTALLGMANQSTHQAQKETFLRTLVDRYPHTKAARKAGPQLREISRPENRGLHISKAFLKENPDLAGPRGLGLKRELLDSDSHNVELTEAGITLLPNGSIALRLESDQGPRTKVYGVPDTAWEQFWRRFREKGYERAATSGDQGLALLAQGAQEADITLKGKREQEGQEGWRLLPYIAGSLSGSNVDVRGTLPKELVGLPLTFGNDQHSTYVGLEMPVPFVPVDFLFLGRNGAPSLFPRIRLPKQDMKDEELYR